MSAPVLGLDDRDLASCVACGLCLPHCPTYRVTGEEAASPRGRIAAMRAVEWDGRAADADFRSFMELCVQCRACEPACPSSVPFGRLMERTRAALAAAQPARTLPRRAALAIVARPRLLRSLSVAGALAQRAGLVPRRLGLPRLPLRRRPLPSTGADVYLFTGCVMDAWMRPVHAAALRVLARAGAGAALPRAGGGCCGALHRHAGLARGAERLARRTMASMPGDAPVLVDAAGCGAAMKEYGEWLGTPDASAFSARVVDVHEWLAAHADRLPPPSPGAVAREVAVQDPCHLRHVQRADGAVRDLLGRYARVVDLGDDGLCCGAGGAYSVAQPVMASALRDRKVEAVRRSGAAVVASANPGCAMHLATGGLTVRHPVELLDEAIGG